MGARLGAYLNTCSGEHYCHFEHCTFEHHCSFEHCSLEHVHKNTVHLLYFKGP